MEYKELYARLCADLEIIVNFKEKIRSPKQLLEDMSLFAFDQRDDDFSPAESWVSTSIYNILPFDAIRIVNLLKLEIGDTISYDPQTGLDLNALLEYLVEHKEYVIKQCESIMNNSGLYLIGVSDDPILVRDVLNSELNDFHNEANSIRKFVNR